MKSVICILNEGKCYSRYAVQIFAKTISTSSTNFCMQPGPIHNAVKPLSWLLGTWVSDNGYGIYPTIQPFHYHEKLTFVTVGQPIINYSAESWHPKDKRPMHIECGFLRLNLDGNNFSFLLAHNFGVTTVEEGCLIGDPTTICMSGKSISRMSFSKPPYVVKTERVYKLNEEGDLEVVFSMGTDRTDHTEHLSATYKKVP